MTDNKPLHPHSCNNCVFLGTVDGNDLYWCPQHLQRTAIYQNEPVDVSEGECLVRQNYELCSTGGWSSKHNWHTLWIRSIWREEVRVLYVECLKRACLAGHVAKNVWVDARNGIPVG